MTANHLHITHDGARATVLLDGEDVADKIHGYQITAKARELPRVILDLSGNATAHTVFEGMAEVEIAREQPVLEPGPAAAEFLAAMDPETVEKAALARLDLEAGPHAVTAAILRQLMDWARGRGA